MTANTLTEATNDWVVRNGAGSLLTTLNVDEAFVLEAVDTAMVNVVEPPASTTIGNTSTRLKGATRSTVSKVKDAFPSFTTSTVIVASDSMGTSPNWTSEVAK